MPASPDCDSLRVWKECVCPAARSLYEFAWNLLIVWILVCFFFALHPLTGHRLAISDPALSKAILQAQPPAEVAPVAAQAL